MGRLGNAVRIGAGPAALVLAAVLTLVLLQTRWDAMLPTIRGIGGPFALVNHHGKAVTERDYLGKPTLVFFGFTFCPDVCPTTLFDLSNRLSELGPDADRLNVLFISVDPERDTPQQLALFLASFDPRITGLSGTPANVSAAMKAYRVYAHKVPLEGGDYTMDHTAVVYMMNGKGRFVGIIESQEPETTVRAKIQRLLDLEEASRAAPA